MTDQISLDDAVDLLYHGRMNVCKAAVLAQTKPDVLKRLLLERVESKPAPSPLQLSLHLH